MSGLIGLARPSMLLPCMVLAAIFCGSTGHTAPQTQEDISSLDDLGAEVCQNLDKDQCGISLLQRKAVHGSASNIHVHVRDPAALVSSKRKAVMTHNARRTKKSSQGE